LWINHKAKKIWRKKYSSKDGKYKKAHKEAAATTARSTLRRRDELLSEV